MYYLQEFGIDQIGEIGLDLGLSFATLRLLSSEKFREEVIEAWLQKKDRVEERSGAPTWKSLKDVLQKRGLTEAAEKILKGNSEILRGGVSLKFFPLAFSLKDNTRLEMAKLVNFCWNVGTRRDVIKIVDEAGSKWSMIGLNIGMAYNKIEAIEEECPTVTKRFEKTLDYWIKNGSKDYPATWIGLRKVLEEIELPALSDRIKNVL